jgi:hypothetical protein
MGWRLQSVGEEAVSAVFIGLNVFKPSDVLAASSFNSAMKFLG